MAGLLAGKRGDDRLPQQQRRIAADHSAGYAESLIDLDVVRQLEPLDFERDCYRRPYFKEANCIELYQYFLSICDVV